MLQSLDLSYFRRNFTVLGFNYFRRNVTVLGFNYFRRDVTVLGFNYFRRNVTILGFNLFQIQDLTGFSKLNFPAPFRDNKGNVRVDFFFFFLKAQQYLETLNFTRA